MPLAVTATVVADPVVRLEGLKLTVTPLGAVAVSVTVPLKPFIPTADSVKDVFAPGNRLIDGIDGFRARVGCTLWPDAGH